MYSAICRATLQSAGEPLDPAAMTEAQIDRLVRATESVAKAADRKYQITCKTVKDATKLSCSARAGYNALLARGVRFHPAREKTRSGRG